MKQSLIVRGWSRFLAGCACFMVLACGLWASAQSYSIDWYKVADGGGTSTGGVYSVNGTIGQPDASGPMTGGNYSLTGGFWSLISVMQTVGAPLLSIHFTSTNTVVVSWPSPSTGFGLQQNADLASPSWGGVLGTINDDGTNKFIIIDPLATGSPRFYRLVK